MVIYIFPSWESLWLCPPACAAMLLSPVRQSLMPLSELYEFFARPSATCAIKHRRARTRGGRESKIKPQKTLRGRAAQLAPRPFWFSSSAADCRPRHALDERGAPTPAGPARRHTTTRDAAMPSPRTPELGDTRVDTTRPTPIERKSPLHATNEEAAEIKQRAKLDPHPRIVFQSS